MPTLMPWPLLLLGLEFPALLALLDCVHREPDAFARGEADRRSWIRWLILAVLTAWLVIGNAILLGYYHVVVRGNSMARR
jgi:hypothetical protein